MACLLEVGRCSRTECKWGVCLDATYTREYLTEQLETNHATSYIGTQNYMNTVKPRVSGHI